MKKDIEELDFTKDFPPVSTQEWEEVIMRDLKGADYEKKLVWKTVEGLKINPYYRDEHTQNLSVNKHLPCKAPFLRGNKKDNNNWLIRQTIYEDKPEMANKKAMDACSRGAESVSLNVAACHNSGSLEVLLKGLPFDKLEIHFYGASSYIQLSDMLLKVLEKQNVPPESFKGSFNFDSLGYFIANNKFYASPENNFVELSQLYSIMKEKLPQIRVVNINADRIHNNGGLVTHEIAYALAMGAEYLTQLTSKGEDIDEIAQRIEFTFAVGSNYFMEIAKIRAARLLWASLVEAYNPKKEVSKYMRIHSVTSSWNKTLFDPYVNMLRTTTEAMSAAIGGCDTMTVLPFDLTYKNPDNFSERIARNIQIILKEEAYFNKVVDISAGSYYIENLTESLAEASWKMFLEVDSKGGFVKLAESGALTDVLEQAAALKQSEVAKRRRTLVGTNHYPNTDEMMLDKVEPKEIASHLAGKKEIRLSQEFEALRLSTEDFVKRGNARPKVFLLPVGNLAMRKARATFAANFFGCAGYQIIDNIGFKETETAVEAAVSSGAEIVVICSSDEEYETMGVELAKAMRSKSAKTCLVIAGNPANAIDSLKEAGINEFINVRSNLLETLHKFNNILGIN